MGAWVYATILLAIVAAAIALGAVLVPDLRAMRRDMGKLDERMGRLEERMARLEGWFGGFLQGKREADVQP